MTTVSRRSVAKGAAWAVPALTVGAPAAYAAVSGSTTVTGSVCGITYDDGTESQQNMRVYLGVDTSTGIIPAGTTLTWTVNTSGGTAANNEVPTTNWSAGSTWTLTTSPAAGTVASSYTVTMTFASDLKVADSGPASWCAAELLYTDVYSISPRTQIAVTSNAATGSGVGSSTSSSLTWVVPKRNSTSNPSTGAPVATRYVSKTQGCYPSTTYIYKSGNVAARGTNGSTCGDGGNNSSTIYPDGTCRKVNITGGQATIPAVCA